MSGPKAGGYEVVSPEELERRALMAAQDRYRRVCAEYNGVVALLGAYGQRLPEAEGTAAGDSGEVAAAAEGLETRLGEAREQLSQHRVAAALSAIPRVTVHLSRPRDQAPDRSAQRFGGPGRDRAAEADRMVAVLLGETGGELTPTLRGKLAGIRTAISDRQQRLAVDDLRLAVQRLRDAHRARQRRQTEVAEILGVLDGCHGIAASRLRAALLELPADGELPVTVQQARSIAAADAAARDAEFVQSAVVDVLEDLGYEVGEPAAVAVAEEGLLLSLPGHPDHRARLRARPGELQFNVVRVGAPPRQGGARPAVEAAADTGAEVDACRVFADVREGLRALGVEWRLRRQDAPGAVPVARTTHRPEGAVRSAAPRRRRRRGDQEREIGR